MEKILLIPLPEKCLAHILLSGILQRLDSDKLNEAARATNVLLSDISRTLHCVDFINLWANFTRDKYCRDVLHLDRWTGCSNG